VIADIALHPLVDPPAGVGGEAGVGFRVEAQGGPAQADGSLGDEVFDLGTLVAVVSGEFEDQAHIAQHERIERLLGGPLVLSLNAVGQRYLLLGGEQLVVGEPVQGRALVFIHYLSWFSRGRRRGFPR